MQPTWFHSYNDSVEGNMSGLIELPMGKIIRSTWLSYGKSLLTKYDAQGKMISAKKICGLNSNLNYIIQKGIYLDGACYYIAYSGNVVHDYMLLKTDTNLNPIWAKRYLDVSGVGLEFQSIHKHDNNIYLSVIQNSTRDNIMLKLDSSGGEAWAKNFSKKNANAIQLRGVVKESNGKLISTGRILTSGIPNQHPILVALDTSFSVLGCEELRTVSESNFTVVSSSENVSTSFNSFSVLSTSIVSNSINNILFENICPWEQRDTTLCQGDSIRINNRYEKVAGIYPDSLISSSGCDSIILRNLIISSIRKPRVFLGDDNVLCSGDSLIIRNKHLTNLIKQWHDNSSLDSFVVYEPGEFWLEEQNRCGITRDTIIIRQEIPPQVYL